MISNELAQEKTGVWRLQGHKQFSYSDGAASEKYLEKVLSQSSDLTCNSDELQSHIKDWPSEYHLTRKRAQLLSGLSFDRSSTVLEVGCGCGAITRHLAESFDTVVSIEGSIERARLARIRTRDLDTVSIVCAPFQEIKFKRKFDIIFCIGVFEYSGEFVDDEDPYRAVLSYFKEILEPEGKLVIAIENQFGLKYFNGAREDHLGTYYEGIEGYHRGTGSTRTFGKEKITGLLKENFDNVNFYYPYPDYKIPDCVLSSEFLSSGKAGEIISEMISRDYSGPTSFSFSERLANIEISNNLALDFFSNSFLIISSNDFIDNSIFDQLGILFSNGRLSKYSTITKFHKDPSGRITAEKKMLMAQTERDRKVWIRETSSPFWDGGSLSTQLFQRAQQANMQTHELFEICKPWYRALVSEAFEKDGKLMLDGSHLDSIWRNAYIQGNDCKIIDREWVWHEPLSLNVVTTRAIFDFLSTVEKDQNRLLPFLPRSGKAAVNQIAETFGLEISGEDFRKFTEIEAHLSSIASGNKQKRYEHNIKWFLTDRKTRQFFLRFCPHIKSLYMRSMNKISTKYLFFKR